MALNDIGYKKSTVTVKTLAYFKILCDHAYTYPDAVIQYHTSDMSLYCDIDVTFLLQPNYWSRYAGYFYLGDEPPPDPIKP